MKIRLFTGTGTDVTERSITDDRTAPVRQKDCVPGEKDAVLYNIGIDTHGVQTYNSCSDFHPIEHNHQVFTSRHRLTSQNAIEQETG